MAASIWRWSAVWSVDNGRRARLVSSQSFAREVGYCAALRGDEAAGGRGAARDFHARLGKAAPGLSKRERDVCAGVAAGLTSEGIALELGVGINTVLTYCKRAYARLGISSQNELMRILM